MKKMITKIILLALIGLSNVTNGQSPNWLWAKSAGGSNNDWGSSIAADGNGSSYVTGYYSSSITFGTTTLTNAGSTDIYIVKYDAGGNVVWAKSAGGPGSDVGMSIAVDGSGSSYVTGYYGSSVTFGTTTLTSAGGGDVFIVKYDSGGDVVWANSAGGTSNDGGISIAVDGSGNSYVTGHFLSPSTTFGTTTLNNAGGRDIFIVKYDAGGNVVWAKSAGGGGYDYGYSIAVDGSGSSYVTGSFQSSSITFGTTTLTNIDTNDIFIVNYDAGGNVVWAKSAGGTSSDVGNSIAVDGSGSSYVTGSFQSSSITFGTTTLTNAGGGDIYIVKYDVIGNVVWAKSAGGSGDDLGRSIAVDGSGSSFVTGWFDLPSITFGTTTLTSAGYNDIFIVKYDAGGNVVWAKGAGGTGGDAGLSIAVDGSGSSYVTGSFAFGTVTFDTTTVINAGGYDMFIAKLASTITGIENNTLNYEVSVYPNPTTGLLFLSNNYNVTLTDLTGKIIAKEQNTNAVDISNQPAGLYFLLLTDNKGQIVKRSKVTKE